LWRMAICGAVIACCSCGVPATAMRLQGDLAAMARRAPVSGITAASDALKFTGPCALGGVVARAPLRGIAATAAAGTRESLVEILADRPGAKPCHSIKDEPLSDDDLPEQRSPARSVGLEFSHEDAVRFVQAVGGVKRLKVLLGEDLPLEAGRPVSQVAEAGEGRRDTDAPADAVETSDEESEEELESPSTPPAAGPAGHSEEEEEEEDEQIWRDDVTKEPTAEVRRDMEQPAVVERRQDDGEQLSSDEHDAASKLPTRKERRKRARKPRAKKADERDEPAGRLVIELNAADIDPEFAEHLKIMAMFKQFLVAFPVDLEATKSERFGMFCIEVMKLPRLRHQFANWMQSGLALRFMRSQVKMKVEEMRLAKEMVRSMAEMAPETFTPYR